MKGTCNDTAFRKQEVREYNWSSTIAHLLWALPFLSSLFLTPRAEVPPSLLVLHGYFSLLFLGSVWVVVVPTSEIQSRHGQLHNLKNLDYNSIAGTFHCSAQIEFNQPPAYLTVLPTLPPFVSSLFLFLSFLFFHTFSTKNESILYFFITLFLSTSSVSVLLFHNYLLFFFFIFISLSCQKEWSLNLDLALS